MGGRITANLGTDYKKATPWNCFINGPVSGAEIKYTRKNKKGDVSYPVKIKTSDSPDDLNNIFLTILEQAKTLASEGGYGINFDFIRPRGSIIKGVGIKHPGVVSYMKIWDSVSNMIVKGDDDGYKDKIKNYLNDEQAEELKELVKKTPRKGAMMGALSVWHPDIEEFVRAKQQPGVLTKFNVSIGAVDGFMEAVAKNDFYNLVFEGEVIKKIKAVELYDLIMDSTYSRGEPGILFLDNMHRNNPISYIDYMNSTNPCLAPGTLISVEGKGLIPVEKVKKNDKIQTTLGFRKISSIIKHDNIQLYRIHFSDGFYIDATDAHIFHSCKGTKIEEVRKKWDLETNVGNLYVGDYIRKSPYLKTDINKKCIKESVYDCRDYGLLLGLYFGDGCFSNYQCFNISSNSDDDNSYIEDLYRRLGFKCRIDKSEGKALRYYATETDGRIKELFKFFKIKDKGEKEIPYKVFNMSSDFRAGLLDGLISSDGNVNLKSRYPQVRFKNSSYSLHKSVRELMLLIGSDYKLYTSGRAGEKSIIYEREVERKKDCYEGIIDNDSIKNFYTEVGYLSHRQKNENLERIINNYSLNGVKWKTRITKIEKINKSTVYDLHEETTDNWIAGGLVSRGCGEIGGFPSLTTVCLLLSLTLTQYVRPDRTFDWDQFKEDIKTATRMADNVNEFNVTPLPSYQWAVENFRQFGMGVNGLGSAMMMMGIKYNSKEGVKFAEKIFSIKENLTWQASAELAKEKGVFPLYDKNKFCNTEYFKSDRITEETRKIIRKYGVRNAKTTTNPPLGNSSIVCDSVSNGIETVFLIEYERKKIVNSWPEGLTKENIEDVLKHKKKKDYEYWEGEYEGKRYYYEPHNRGLLIRNSFDRLPV